MGEPERTSGTERAPGIRSLERREQVWKNREGTHCSGHQNKSANIFDSIYQTQKVIIIKYYAPIPGWWYLIVGFYFDAFLLCCLFRFFYWITCWNLLVTLPVKLYFYWSCHRVINLIDVVSNAYLSEIFEKQSQKTDLASFADISEIWAIFPAFPQRCRAKQCLIAVIVVVMGRIRIFTFGSRQCCDLRVHEK